MEVLRGRPLFVGQTRACNSTKMGRVPSIVGMTTEPVAFWGRSAKKRLEGFSTSSRPFSFISNTAISLVDPKRFFTALRIR